MFVLERDTLTSVLIMRLKAYDKGKLVVAHAFKDVCLHQAVFANLSPTLAEQQRDMAVLIRWEAGFATRRVDFFRDREQQQEFEGMSGVIFGLDALCPRSETE